MSATTTSGTPSDSSIEVVRQEMRRILSPQERASYRGITMAAMTGVMYEELYGIETAEDLIIAELYGRHAIASDDPGNLYLFSSGRGLTARFNSAYTQRVLQEPRPEGVPLPPPKTIAQLDEEYRNMSVPSTPEDYRQVEGVLSSVASDFVAWSRGQNAALQQAEETRSTRSGH